MTRFIASFAIVLLVGCSCCPDSAGIEVRDYPVDDGLAARLGVGRDVSVSDDLCVHVCELLDGRADGGAADAGIGVIVGGRAPSAALSSCYFPYDTYPHVLRCEFGYGCPR